MISMSAQLIHARFLDVLMEMSAQALYVAQRGAVTEKEAAWNAQVTLIAALARHAIQEDARMPQWTMETAA